MFLYLVQHGEAKSEEEDPARGLTEKGIQDVRGVSAYVKKLDVKVGRIYHSGKARTMQTAQIFADHLKLEKVLSVTDGLAPMDDPSIWAKRILGINEDIMLVGHLPHLTKLAGLLLSGDMENMIIDYKMGGMACLKRFADGRWAVEWMIVPQILMILKI
jgi:phosphohistidine phosphatase